MSVRAASGNVSQRPVLTSISDEISSPAVCSPSGVASVRALSSAKRLTSAVRLGIDDLELLLDREGEILRSRRRSRAPRRAPRAGRGCSGPSPRGYQRIRGQSAEAQLCTGQARRNLPIRSRGAIAAGVLPPPGDGRACSAGPPACGPCRSSPSSRSRSSGRSPSGRASAARPHRPGWASGEVEVERVQELDGRARAVHDHVARASAGAPRSS